MNWTLLVPGALLPAALAPELARHMRAPVLAGQLDAARPLAPPAPAPGGGAAPQSPHWQWLSHRFGLDPGNLATAAYAWQPAGPQIARAGGALAAAVWVAHCEPVHLAIARDHFVVTDLAEAPLQAEETRALLALANEVLAGETSASPGTAAPRLRLAIRDARWFLLSPVPLQIRTWSLDAVLGRSVQDRLPTGTDARRWRVLGNEIQMSWHASAVNAAREDAGSRTPNALWLHGGGVWQALGPTPSCILRAPDAPAEAAVVQGWMAAAAASPGATAAPAGTLSICRALHAAHAHQAWETWLAQLPALDARIASELAEARAAGATRFDLVLCGNTEARAWTLPLAPSWWRRLRPGTRAPATVLQRSLAETAPTGADTVPATRGTLAA